jgi:hypothetical protein
MNNSVITSLTLKQRALHNAINGAGSGATEDGRHCDSHVEDAKDSAKSFKRDLDWSQLAHVAFLLPQIGTYSVFNKYSNQ